MKKLFVSFCAGIISIAAVQTTKADVVAGWSFESSGLGSYSPGANTTTTNFLAELGSQAGIAAATSLHLTAATYSSPVGNGSAKSFSANNWSVGDYFQFSLSTVGYTNITLSFSQISSSTGPGSFTLQYSPDGTTYSTFGSAYSVIVNASPNTWGSTSNNLASSYSFDLSSISTLANDSTASFRIVDNNTTSAGGGTVATTGTGRVDNFTVNGSIIAVPEPSTLAMTALGGVACLLAIRRRR